MSSFNCIIKNLSHNKYNMKLFEKKNSYRKHWEQIFRKNTISSYFRSNERFKRIQKLKNLLCQWGVDFRCSKYWFSVDFIVYRWKSYQTLFQTLSSKTRVKLVLSPRLPFLITQASNSNWYALIFVS